MPFSKLNILSFFKPLLIDWMVVVITLIVPAPNIKTENKGLGSLPQSSEIQWNKISERVPGGVDLT